MEYPQTSLRKQILLSFLFIIIFGGLLSLFVGYRVMKNTLIGQAQAKVRHDLSSAWMVFNEKIDDIREVINLTAARESLHQSVKEGDYDILLRRLDRIRLNYGLDVLNLTDESGRVVLRTRRPGVIGDDQSLDEIIGEALTHGMAAGPQIISREALLREGQELADRARIELIPTPKATPRPETVETKGLMLKAAVAMVDENGNRLGILCGGLLINRTTDIVDRIKELVYKDETYKGRQVGTATIFQGDMRISTNVPTESGERAIGTRVSTEVKDAVLGEGLPWIDRAFVVNDWYITAYEPIKSIRGEIIGILYVGMLETPYLDTTRRVMLTFTGVAFLCVLLLLGLLSITTTQIIHPLRQMVLATREIARGDLTHRVEIRSKDEIGHLAEAFNQMTAKLKVANEKLIDWGKTLEKKVEERTSELTKIQSHLIQSEKLASLGKLAAGIAHEINNPLGGILIYSHLLLEDQEKDSEEADTLRKIVKETSRCKDIVKGLLEFARPREPETSTVAVNDIVDKSLAIMERQALFQNILIKKQYSTDVPPTVADGAQLQQVFMNIILNAAEAMEGSGTLTIRSAVDPGKEFIEIRFSDTGHGIKAEDLPRLFEPFFTTKEVGKGTGLGLAISYSIIQRHDGTIEASSREGEGTTFTVKLPIKEASLP